MCCAEEDPLGAVTPCVARPQQVFFRIIDEAPSAAKQVAVPAASGRKRLASSDMCVSLLPIIKTQPAEGAESERYMVALTGSVQSANAVHVFHTLGHGAWGSAVFANLDYNRPCVLVPP